MKRLSILLVIISMFLSCSKVDINEQNILGTWNDDYSDYPYYMNEGYSSYSFGPDGKVSIHIYDVFAGDSYMIKSYILDYDGQKNVIVLFDQDENPSDTFHQYRITKLTKKEMEWQKVGTTFTPGTVGSEFKHFLRK